MALTLTYLPPIGSSSIALAVVVIVPAPAVTMVLAAADFVALTLPSWCDVPAGAASAERGEQTVHVLLWHAAAQRDVAHHVCGREWINKYCK